MECRVSGNVERWLASALERTWSSDTANGMSYGVIDKAFQQGVCYFHQCCCAYKKCLSILQIRFTDDCPKPNPQNRVRITFPEGNSKSHIGASPFLSEYKQCPLTLWYVSLPSLKVLCPFAEAYPGRLYSEIWWIYFIKTLKNYKLGGY